MRDPHKCAAPTACASPGPAPPQWYHAIQRVEAFGQALPASAAARLRGSVTARPLPAPAPGAVPGYLAAELLQRETGDPRLQREEQQQEEQQQPAAQ